MEVQDYVKENLRMKKIDYIIKKETGLIFNEVYILNQIINANDNRVTLKNLKTDLGVSYALLFKYITKIQNRKLATKDLITLIPWSCSSTASTSWASDSWRLGVTCTDFCSIREVIHR